MSKYGGVGEYHGEQREYQGPLLGLCPKCNGIPKMRRHKMWQTFKVECSRCSTQTLDYGDMRTAAFAWNDKAKRKLGE